VEKQLKKINNLLENYQPQIIEIRKIIFRSLSSFVLGGVLGMAFNRKIILFLIAIFDLKKINIVLTSPYQFVNLAVGIAVICGLITTIPIFVYYLLKYIRPALKDKEYNLVKKLIPTSLTLFVFGCFFGGKIEQFVVNLYAQTTIDYSLNNFWDIESFLSQLLIMAFCMGLVFQLPIVLTILIKTKILSVSFLSHQRRYVYCALILFGILMPPTDILSLIMITTPLFLLFEGTLLLNRAN
jgi:sec-independent protein translocase protein TatC